MSVAIQSASTFGSGIAFGNIVASENMQFGLRANSANNLVDLSNNERAIVNTAGYGTAGIVGNGQTGAYVDNLFNDNEYTLYVTAKVDLLNLNTGSHYLTGNFQGITSGFGISLRADASATYTDKRQLILKSHQSYRQADGVSYSSSDIDIQLADNLDNTAISSGWLVVAVRFNLATKKYELKLLITGASAARSTADTYWTSDGIAAVNRNQDVAAIQKYWVGRATNISVAENTTTVPECFYFNRELTDTELAQQLAYTRAFMQDARGVVLP